MTVDALALNVPELTCHQGPITEMLDVRAKNVPLFNVKLETAIVFEEVSMVPV